MALSTDISKIVLVGVDEDFFGVIMSFLEGAFEFIVFEPNQSLNELYNQENIVLFIVNSDSVKFKITEIMENLQNCDKLENVPRLGLSMIRHFEKLDPNLRFAFHDILLMPCNYEDLLNRIDVWIKTFEIMNTSKVVENWCQIN